MRRCLGIGVKRQAAVCGWQSSKHQNNKTPTRPPRVSTHTRAKKRLTLVRTSAAGYGVPTCGSHLGKWGGRYARAKLQERRESVLSSVFVPLLFERPIMQQACHWFGMRQIARERR